MKIKLKEITVKDLFKGYKDMGEKGLFGYGGNLDIRPPYQREFIYKEAQRNAVIDTIIKKFPLNVMYWAVREKGKYEIIDGQQRTVSICQYLNGDFSYNGSYFHSLPDDKRAEFHRYKLMIYMCSGKSSEKLNWFKTINIAGEELTSQELRNAVFAGSWVADAKRYFSKNNSPAYGIASDYVNGVANRQAYLETAIKWISKDKIDDYMSRHQHDKDSKALYKHFKSVVHWINTTFKGEEKKYMKGVDWGVLYDEYNKKKLNTAKIKKEVDKLMLDDDVTKKNGIYPYVLTRDEVHLSIRSFTPAMKIKVYRIQRGICKKCKKKFELTEMEADHIKPWHEGGRTIESNCQMLCRDCNRRKSGK